MKQYILPENLLERINKVILHVADPSNLGNELTMTGHTMDESDWEGEAQELLLLTNYLKEKNETTV